MILSIVILAISLSLDALGVGMAYGLRKVKIPGSSKLIICLFSIFYSGAALAVGSYMSRILSQHASKLIGIVILILMGIWIIFQSLLKGDSNNTPQQDIHEKDKTLFQVAIKSLGITIQVIRNPVQGDIDKSGIIDNIESILLGLALSIDAIGVGIGSALAGFNSIILPFCIGLFQWLFLYTGTFLGKKFSSVSKINRKLISILPGIMLIFIAIVKIL